VNGDTVFAGASGLNSMTTVTAVLEQLP